MKHSRFAIVVIVAACALAAAARGQSAPSPDGEREGGGDGNGAAQDLNDLSLEQLMDIPVSIAARGEQKLADTAAAVYVLTGDEIRRAGMTSIPEALRLVPGFFVQRFDSHTWSVASRGFSGFFVSDLVVMIDGVSIYTPLFAGVWWELQSIDMGDVDRIEVIRGAGATLWGANAVTGIVNVITKSAAETQGERVSLLAGREARELAARYGGKLSDHGSFRAWTKLEDHTANVDSTGDIAPEHWQIAKVGFRADWDENGKDRFTLLGNSWVASIQETYEIAFPTPPYSIEANDKTAKYGGFLLGSWEHQSSSTSSNKLSVWWSKDVQQQLDFELNIDMLDLDFQHTEKLSENQTLSWGAGYRGILSYLPSIFTYTFSPVARYQQTPRVWLQDQLALPSKHLALTFGAQLEHTDFSGLEFQPTIRGSWKPRDDQTLWAAVSRAVRTPSIEENDILFRLPTDSSGDFIIEEGSGNVQSEELLAYELGWRWQVDTRFGIDVTGFYDDYDNLVTLQKGVPFSQGGNNFQPYVFTNLGNAMAQGAELALDFDITDHWRVRSAYSLFTIDAKVDPSSSTSLNFIEGSVPKNQLNLRSYLDLGDHWEFDVGAYYVDRVGSWNNPSFVRTDARLGWNPTDGLAFSLGVQNALQKQHPEGGEDQIGVGSEVRTNWYLGLTISR